MFKVLVVSLMFVIRIIDTCNIYSVELYFMIWALLDVRRQCLPLVVIASLRPSSLWTDQPGAVHEPTLQPDQLPQLPGSPVSERELCVLGVLAVPCPGPDRMLPVPHVLCLHTAGTKVWSAHPSQGPSLQVSSCSVSWEVQINWCLTTKLTGYFISQWVSLAGRQLV